MSKNTYASLLSLLRGLYEFEQHGAGIESGTRFGIDAKRIGLPLHSSCVLARMSIL